MTYTLLGTFVLVLMLFVSNVASLPLLVKYDLVVSLPGGIMEQRIVADSQSHHTVYIKLSDGLINIILFIADTVMLWRAWAVWMNNKKVKWTLLMLMLADMGVSLADCIADFRTPSQVNRVITLDWVYFLLSLFVNMIATCLIAVRTWRHRKSMRSFSVGRRRTKAGGVLLLLVESGAIFALVQLSALIINGLDSARAPPTSIRLVTFLICQLYVFAAAFNPVAILILVHIQNTFEQSFQLSSENSTLSQLAQSQVPTISNRMESTPADF
ncbi:hypothetical protein BDP27DRAFT_1450460 [Rhodocollybia butyracea]|uniref:G-protein coupled receptors family 1 profile domain-containing protein n=1 Tax=Rhodocollybia butyracea TaxID=206335 RepID=A0A9P5U3K8_9AGAR|nr:hypothetical protein BDP27DRAFT_1450460 [Rhodocollybia butyracea]